MHRQSNIDVVKFDMHNKNVLTCLNPFLVKCNCVIFLISCCIAGSILAELTATTGNGRKVILLENGRWFYEDTVQTQNAAPLTSTSVAPQPTSPPVKPSEYIDFIKKSQSSDFRSSSWGATKQLVKKSENATFISESKDTLTYSHTFLGIKCLIVYLFLQDKLVGGSYLLSQNHSNPALFNADYAALKHYLSTLLGKPTSNQDIWKNDIYRADSTQWGFAVSIGFLTRYISWKGTNSKISLQMSGENHTIDTEIKFTMTTGK